MASEEVEYEEKPYYEVTVEDGKLHVTSNMSFKEDEFRRMVMYERYRQLEQGDKPIFVSPTPNNRYTVIMGELKKGIIYNGKARKILFDDTAYDFMIGREGDKISVRQINGSPFTDDDATGNKFISQIKSSQRRQIDNLDEHLPKGTNVDDYIHNEILRGIVVNGMFVSSDRLLGTTTRRRRR